MHNDEMSSFSAKKPTLILIRHGIAIGAEICPPKLGLAN